MKPHKGRSVETGQRVHVYRNLHKNCWSIKDDRTGLVLGHAQNVLLKSAHFHVNERGRQRVLQTGNKNVHAWVDGYYWDSNEETPIHTYKHSIAYYNPRKVDSFVDITTNEPLSGVFDLVVLGHSAYYQREARQ